MDIPRYHRSPVQLPEICVETTDRYQNSSRSKSYASGSHSNGYFGMPIPNVRNQSPPPPLPPPKHFDLEDTRDGREPDLGWQWSNAREYGSNWSRQSSVSVAPGSSLNGTFAAIGKTAEVERPDFERRSSSTSTVKPSPTSAQRHNSFPLIDPGHNAAFPGRRESGPAFLPTPVQIGSISRHEEITPFPRFQSSMHEQYQTTTTKYDSSLLKKLDNRRKPERTTPPRDPAQQAFSSSLDESRTKSSKAFDRSQKLQPLSLPIINTKQEYNESPVSGWGDNGTPSISPRSPYVFRRPSDSDPRSATERNERDKMGIPHRPLNSSSLKNGDDMNDYNRPDHGSYDQGYGENDLDFPAEETSGLRRLHIDDRVFRSEAYSPQSAAGQKRRASSPPREDQLPSLHTVGSQSDLFRRRESTSRSSPVPRIHSNHGSISSTASGPRNNSYASTFSLAPTVSTMSSYGRLSPSGLSPGGFSSGGLSPGGLSIMGHSPGALSIGGLSPGSTTPGGLSPRTPDEHLDSPYASPRGSVSLSQRPMHQRTISFENRCMPSSRKSSTADMAPANNVQDGFVCECCPKKPKKFETAEQLTAHEQEKQYECAYCKNRFKNKNEAERHQNSLHLRRHSWSCAALTGYAAAFHHSPARPNDADTCGYCGDEFPRSGPIDPERGMRIATDRDFEARIQHLTEVHKFGECNHAKKFFRADHFRQHLKHSHAGTSGKWTNMLENACMRDEPLPVPRIREELED